MTGNWPTPLPWGLEIDPSRYPAGRFFPAGTTFHPTFLYESMWNVALCLALVQLHRRRPMRPGRLLAVYVAGYAVGRFLVESLRIDSALDTGGLRLNQWTAIVAFGLAVGFLVIDRVGRGPAPASDGGTEPDSRPQP